MKNSKTIFINYCLPIISVIFLAGLAYAGWTPAPTGSVPPANNVEPPLTSGAATAYKAGALGIGGLFESDVETHLALLGGRVGIGTANPIEKLQIAGKAIADDFCLNSDPTKCLSSAGTGVPGTTGGGVGDCICYSTFSGYMEPVCMASYMNCGTGWTRVGNYCTAFNRAGWGSASGQTGYYRCSKTEEGLSSSGALTPSSSGGSQLFFSSGTFTAPAGVTSVTVELWGGGSGGGGGGGPVGDLCPSLNAVGPNTGGGGGGGGSGGYKKATVNVAPGTNYAVSVGNGGAGGSGGAPVSSWSPSSYVCGNSGSSGSNGGSSSVTGLVSVSGGSGGGGGHPACRDPDGAGGYSADGGSGGAAGEGGSNGVAGNRWDDGGTGGLISGSNGVGGSGGTGGIGVCNNSGSSGAAGARGGDGFVLISW